MKKQLIVGGTLKEAADRVAAAWGRVTAGEDVLPQDNTTFASWTALSSVLTDRRFELLRHVRARPAPSIRALARDLGRDFKRVHEDVTALEAAGLLSREDGVVRTDYDVIHTSILIAA